MKKLVVILNLVGFVAAISGALAAPPKPNVLLICVDDLKPLLGCYGDPRIKTPNMDRLARRGVLFEKAYCNQAVCAPSRNTLMTGLRPTKLGIYDLGTNFRKAAPDAVTLSQYFMQHGYYAEGMGKIYHEGHGNQDDAASWSIPHWNPKAETYALPENRTPSRPRSAAKKTKARGAPTECANVPDTFYGDGKTADEAIRRLQKAGERQGQPFFMAVGFIRPHLAFVAPKKYWDLYDRADFSLPALRVPPAGAPEFAPTSWGELRQYSDIPQVGPVSDDQARLLIHGYHASVSYVDAQIGRVLDELERLGLDKTTIVVLWGDHGWHLGDHGMWCKHTNYEQAARIPVIVSAPGRTPGGARCRALIETADIYPTLCELAGLPAPRGLDGKSFVPALKDPASAKTKEAVFHVYPRSSEETGWILGRAVRTERFRLVEWKKPGGPDSNAIFELYDYLADPEETANLAARKPEIVAELRVLLARQSQPKPQWTPSPIPENKGN